MKKPSYKNGLLSKERKDFFRKVTEFAARKIQYLYAVEKMTKTEIAEVSDLQNPRITEILNFGSGNYKNPISDNTLQKLLGGDVLSIKEIKENCELSKKEKQFLDEFEPFERKTTRDLIKKLGKKYGHDLDRELQILLERENNDQ